MALLLFLPCENHLHRLLSQNWLRSWEGWVEWDKSKRNIGSVDLSDDSFAEEFVRRLVAISMDQVVIDFPTDAERRQELLDSCQLDVKHGDGAGNNCLTDSLLKCLLYHGVIITPGSESRPLKWRRKLCDEVRNYLCGHDDVRLRPKQRDECSAIRSVSSESHNSAFLEHHCHAAPVVIYLVSKCAEKRFRSFLWL